MRQFFENIIFMAIATLSFVILTSLTVDATVDFSAIGYGYRIIKPDNQIGDSESFDLRMTPNQQQEIEIEFFNLTDKECRLNLYVNSAKTNGNGVVVYGPSDIEVDHSLKYDIKDIITMPEQVTLLPNETKRIPLNISMPSEEFQGYLSGGIYIQKDDTTEKNKQRQGVVNKYAFVLGILLSEFDTKVSPEMQFNKIYVGLSNYRAAFFIDFSNVSSDYVENMNVYVHISKKGSDKILYKVNQEKYRMAPNSAIDFPVLLGKDRLKEGDYTGYVVVSVGDQEWKWQQDFNVTKDEVISLTSQEMPLDEPGFNWFLLLGIISVCLAVTFLGVWLLQTKLSPKTNKSKSNFRRKKSV